MVDKAYFRTHSGSAGRQYIPNRRIPGELRQRIGTGGHDLRLRLASPAHCCIEKASRHPLPAKAVINLGVVDDDQRGVGAAVCHLGKPLSILVNEECTSMTCFFVSDYVFNHFSLSLSDGSGGIMRNLATFLLVAAAFPALAHPKELISEPLEIMKIFTAPNAKCYFIRQTNRQLQAPQDRPQLMPLAGAAQLPTTPGFTNCMPEQRIIKVGGR